jgi:hypothetical protein
MNTANFTKLIQAVTGREFTVSERVTWREEKPAGETLEHEKIYFVARTLPLTGRTVGFDWKTPKSDEKMLRSFITAFTSKYREPNPETYVREPSGYGRNWSDLSPEQREGAYGHHVGHMFSKEQLLNQVQARFECPEIETALNQWGFYETEYGIGIFCYWETQFVRNAIARMRGYLSGLNVAAREEYSDARWVYRFRIETSREFHTATLKRFCQS